MTKWIYVAAFLNPADPLNIIRFEHWSVEGPDDVGEDEIYTDGAKLMDELKNQIENDGLEFINDYVIRLD